MVCSSLLFTLAPAAAPGTRAARAASGSSTSSSSITDRRGDVKDENDATAAQPEADIVAAGATDRGGDLVFTLLVDRPTDPTTTRNWEGGPTGPGATPTDEPDPNLTRESGGYWLAGGDGGVFSFNVDFYGSTGDIRMNKPIVGLVADPSGPGYWFVASDGGIFAFGHAAFFGSAGSVRLNQPIVGMAATSS